MRCPCSLLLTRLLIRCAALRPRALSVCCGLSVQLLSGLQGRDHPDHSVSFRATEHVLTYTIPPDFSGAPPPPAAAEAADALPPSPIQAVDAKQRWVSAGPSVADGAAFGRAFMLDDGHIASWGQNYDKVAGHDKVFFDVFEIDAKRWTRWVDCPLEPARQSAALVPIGL
jgi:hypothetical protein